MLQCVSVLSAELVSKDCAASDPCVFEWDESTHVVVSVCCEISDEICVSGLQASELVVQTVSVLSHEFVLGLSRQCCETSQAVLCALGLSVHTGLSAGVPVQQVIAMLVLSMWLACSVLLVSTDSPSASLGCLLGRCGLQSWHWRPSSRRHPL